MSVDNYEGKYRKQKLSFCCAYRKAVQILTERKAGIGSLQAQSRADFISKLSIALKEASETNYWFRLLHASKYLSDPEFSSVIADCRELEKMLTSILKTSRNSSHKSS